jgi:poly(3-hydroxybutyrate) depolymerase
MSFSKPLLLLTVLLFSSPALAEKIVKESITSDNKKRTIYLFVPDSVKAGTPVPLVVLLHGSGRNGASLVEKWKDLASKESFIVVGPDSLDPSIWKSPTDGPDFLRDVVENIKSRYSINPRRVYLFGHSGGAIFALYMSLLESRYYAATAIHAGAIDPNDPAVNYAKRKIPISLTVGTKDPLFPVSDVRATRDLLVKNGIPAELNEIPNHNHWYYDLAPKINQSAWEFLKKHELGEDPQFEQYNYK